LTVERRGFSTTVSSNTEPSITLRCKPWPLSLGCNLAGLVIGTVSRLDDDHKRISDLLEAVAGIDRSDVQLLIVGDGPDRLALEKRVADLRLTERVIFAGSQVDVAPWYRVMDVFALASAREAFGLVNVEAMLASLPVVATRVGGIPEIVEDGTTGLLVPPRSPERLRESLLTMVEDPELRCRLGREGKNRAERLFSVGAYVREIDKLYTDLVGR
jgi:L-malate glycosyltransferase